MITYHHIGGRNGTYPFPLKDGKLLEDFHLVLYDADSDCLSQMEKAERGAWGKVSVYPYCIGDASRQATFNINFHATTNSLYSFNHDFADYNFVSSLGYGEYRMGDACHLEKQINIELLTLEEALHRAGNKSVDFLSIDVQGAEYDILLGGKKFLQENCLGFELEVEFLKVYKDQKTFCDLNRLLEEMDFELVDLNSFGRLAPISLPIGFRGLEQPAYAEGIYLKKLSSVVASGKLEKLYKWCFFALAYQKIGLCLQGLTRLAEVVDVSSILAEDPHYVVLLKKIAQLFIHEEHRSLPRISELFSHKMLQSFYAGSIETVDSRQDRERLNQQLADKYLPFLEEVELEKRVEESAFEILLKEYDLCSTSELVKKNRMFELDCFVALIQSRAQKLG